MDSAEALQRRIKGTRELGSVVRTMKTLAAVSVHHYEEAVGSLEVYSRTIELALQAVARQMPDDLAAVAAVRAAQEDGGSREGAIVLGTDQGMCGAFNDQLAAYLKAARGGAAQAAAAGPVWAVGSRLAPALQDAGMAPESVFGAPGSVEGITGKVSELLSGFDAWLRGAGIGRVGLYYQRSAGPGLYRPHHVQLWPVDLGQLAELRRSRWESRSLPMVGLPWQDMVRPIIRQRLFIALYRGFAESLASENAARLSAMERAEKNVEERLAELQREFNYLRQQSITVELLDIIAGYEALRDRKPRG